MTLALSTRWFGARPTDAPRLLEVLRTLDVRACFLAPSLRGPAPAALDRTLRPAGARVVGVSADSTADEPSSFTSRDPQARGRALAAARTAAALGKAVGGRHVVLDLGRFDLERAREREAELFGALREDGPTDAVREQASGIAAAVDRRLEPALDGLCRLLFDLCRAEPELRFAVRTPGGPFDVASARALGLILDEVREQNLGYWHDVGAAHRHAQLGLSASQAWFGEFGSRTFGAFVHDAAGADTGLPPGAGEIEFRHVAEGLPSGIPVVVDVDGRFPLAELRLAVSYLRSVGF